MRSILITILCLIILRSQAQKTYNDSNSKFTFRLSIDSLAHLDSSGYSYYVKTIDIFKEREALQSIQIDSAVSFPDYLEDHMLFVVEDVNFDGYNDIRILNWLGISFDTEYRYWFYDTRAEKFTEDSTLIAVMNPRFNQQKKLICENYRSGADIFGFRRYIWAYGEIMIIEELSHEVYPAKNGYKELLSHYTFENGKFRDKVRPFKEKDWYRFPCVCE